MTGPLKTRILSNRQMTVVSIVLMLVCLDYSMPTYAKSSLSGYEIRSVIVDEAMYWGVEPELALAVARVESNFNPRALSHAGARGVMQIMPATARSEYGVPKYELYDPNTNIRIGVRYLKQLLNRYDDNEELALSHYNGGSKVRRDDGSLAVIPYTRDYVDKVLAQKARYANHSLVLAAKRGESPRYSERREKLAQLDDFGSFSPVTRWGKGSKSSYSHESFSNNSIALDDERASLVRELRALKFRNNYRAVSDHSHRSYAAEQLDDF